MFDLHAARNFEGFFNGERKLLSTVTKARLSMGDQEPVSFKIRQQMVLARSDWAADPASKAGGRHILYAEPGSEVRASTSTSSFHVPTFRRP